MGKSEEELIGLPPIPSGYQLAPTNLQERLKQPQELPPLPEGYQLVSPQAVPQVEPQKESQFGSIVKDTLKGAAQDMFGLIEAPVSLASGFMGFIPGFLTNVVAQTHPDISYEEAEELGNQVAGQITYQPTTKMGQSGAELMGVPFRLLSEMLDEWAEAVNPGDPNAQAAFRTLAWAVAIMAGPSIKSGIKQQAATWKARGKSLPPEVVKTIASQEIQKVAETTFKFGEEPAVGMVRKEAPKPKTGLEVAEQAMVQREGRYIPSAKPEVKPKPKIIKEYPEYYIEKQKKILVEKEKLPTFKEFEEKVWGKPKEAPKVEDVKKTRIQVEERLKEWGESPLMKQELRKQVERLKEAEKASKVEKPVPEIEAIETRPLTEKEIAKAREAGLVEELPPTKKKPVSFEEEIGGEYTRVVEEINREIEKKQVGQEPKLGLAVEMVEPVPRVGKFKFKDAEIESRFETAKGVPREPLMDRARRNLISLKHKATRTFEHLPNVAEFIEAKTALKTLARQRATQAYNTLNTLRGITINFRGKPAQMDMFRRKVILEDLAREAEIGHDLPFGFTKESVTAELSRLDAATKPYKAITDALGRRRRVWDAVTNNYVKYAKKAGVDLEGKLEKPDYFRHQVLEYARLKGIAETGKRLRKPGKRGFLQERKGSEFDINTDYFEAEYEVMSQMLYDIEVYKTVKAIEKNYDISKKVRAEAKAEGLENWHDAIPEGYEVWQPKEGNTFYFADTISSRIAQDIMNDALTDIGVVKDGLKKAMAMGGKRKEWVIKSELAKTLTDLTQREKPSWMGKLNKKILRAWKVWTLISPRRHVKYNLRNMTGDADAALVGNIRGFKKSPKAVSDLYDFYVLDKPMKGEFKEWHNRGGMETTLQAQELGDIKGLKWFKEFSDKKGGIQNLPEKVWKKYWRGARLSTDFREAILRYANYLDYLDQVKVGKGKPKNYGASLPWEIDALKNPRDKAFRLSNELLGAYDEISVFGQGIREQVFPFWSWKELNFRRYVRLFKNATRDNKTAMGMAKGILPVISRTPVLALKFGRFAIKATAFWSALQVWNHTMFPEEERLLPDNVKGRAHVIFGRDDDGNIVYFSRLGALSDFLEWFGLDAAPQLVTEWLNGKKSIKDIGKHMMKAPVNQVVQGLHPVKGVFEVMLRRSLFPDAFDPKTIRDRGLHIARSMALENEYKAIQGKPGKPYVETLPLFAVYHVDPFESAYHEAFDMKNEYLKKFGKRGEGFWMTPRGDALYNMKLAHRYGDKKSEDKYYADYVKLHAIEGEAIGKTRKEVEDAIEQGKLTSFLNMHPLSGMSEKERVAFVISLNEEEIEIMVKAVRFYNDVLIGASKVDIK